MQRRGMAGLRISVGISRPILEGIHSSKTMILECWAYVGLLHDDYGDDPDAWVVPLNASWRGVMEL